MPGPERQHDRSIRRSDKELLEFERAIQLISERDAGEKGRVGHAQDRKGLERSRQRSLMRMIVREYVEQITENLPEEKEHHEIGAGHHADQDEVRQANHGEIPTGVPVLVHVSRGVGVDNDAHTGNQRHHDRAEAVDIESEGDRKRSHRG